jgi:hypothetical protein
MIKELIKTVCIVWIICFFITELAFLLITPQYVIWSMWSTNRFDLFYIGFWFASLITGVGFIIFLLSMFYKGNTGTGDGTDGTGNSTGDIIHKER